jgi:hypothetical protein
MNKFNFTGRLIYFDYQQHDCLFDYHPSLNINNNLSLSKNSKRYPSYYRSTLSFRTDHDSSKSLNSTEYSRKNFSLLLNNTNLILNSCHNKITKNIEYFSFKYLNSQLSKSSQFYSHSLFDTLNLIIQILNSNLINCKTYRLKQIKKKINSCYFSNINIYSTRKSLINKFNFLDITPLLIIIINHVL